VRTGYDMDSIDTLIHAFKGIHDLDRQRTIARKVALNEAYYNIGLFDIIETKALSESRLDRNKLILKLRTDSKGAFDIYNIDKSFFGKFVHKAKTTLAVTALESTSPPDKYADWTETEIHHYVVSKIEILKAVVEAKLSNESKLRIMQRVKNIKQATRALIDTIGV
jgi:hypothetical protein